MRYFDPSMDADSLVGDAGLHPSQPGFLTSHQNDKAAVRVQNAAEDMPDQLNTPCRWSVFWTNQDKVKRPSVWFPSSDVTDMDSIRPMRQPSTGKVDELWNDIQPVGLYLQTFARTPLLGALHQNPTRTTDIEKCAASVNGLGDKPARRFPGFRVTAVTRLSVGIVAGKVGRSDEGCHRGVPTFFVDSPVVQGLID